MRAKINFNFIIYFFFFIYLIIGLLIFRDYGVGIEEHFQRQNGFYWLNYLFSNSGLFDFKELINLKYNLILKNNPSLPNPDFFNFYGIVFDLPLALIETFFEIESSKLYFELRHFFTFLIFFTSSIFFYKIIKDRFSNKLVILLGLFFYVASPRIFGDSFHNNKDILFLSLLVIAIHYLFQLFRNHNYKSLILFCLFSALASSSRIMGIYLPFFAIIFYFLEFLIKNYNFKKFIVISLQILFFFIFFLYLHYPYIWELSLFNFGEWFKKFFYWMDIKLLFNGEYYSIKYLPRSYLPVWILISIPLSITVPLLFGIFFSGKIIFKRIINLKDHIKNKKGDLWNSINEKKDFFIFISFFSFFFYAVFLNVAMLSGWRHFYFLHFFLIYFSILGLDSIYAFLIKKFNIKIIYIASLLIFTNIIFTNIQFHPFQSLYFLDLLGTKKTNNFQIDTPSLSRYHALNFILELENKKNKKIFVANASWTPMHNGKDMLDDKFKDKFIFVGQNYSQADYIYNNYIYKNDEKYNKNYNVPDNFLKIRDYKINNVLIYSVFKKKK